MKSDEFTRREFLKAGAAAAGIVAMGGVSMAQAEEEKAKVYFTKDLSAEGLKKIYGTIGAHLSGKTAIKLHTGEPDGPNIIPREWVKALLPLVPNPTIVECNVYYTSPRQTTKGHRETLKRNGWTFSPVDIMDEDGEADLPISHGLHFDHLTVGKNLLNYESMLVLTHFKGHTVGGFGGSLKNIAIGCASGKTGKKQLHTPPNGSQWGYTKERFMENMADGGKAIVDHFGSKIVYINVLRNMSVSCDCEGVAAAPVTTPDIGILASTDILAIDKASVDMVYALPDKKGKDLIERMESRSGLRQLSAMKELHMGSDSYEIINI